MPDADNDKNYMQRCLDLALKGLGSTAPNPMVGSVIVADGKIIGEGYHQVFGGPHAEVNAITSVKDKSLLKSARLYVNLEPCSHEGKTPPCSTLIHDSLIPEVVIGNIDPNKLVAGKGKRYLEKNRLRVRMGVMEDECRELNRRFITFHEKGRPYIILKWAQSRDGFIDRKREKGSNVGINWISDKQARQLVHKWRSEEQAILVGTNTAEIDDPRLTVRDWEGKDPLRLVIDIKGRLSPALKLFDGSTRTLVFTRQPKTSKKNLEFVEVPEEKDVISFLLSHLHSIDIQSLIIEGGAHLLGSLISMDLWDEARVFSSQHDFGDGLKAPDTGQAQLQEISIGTGSLKIYRKT